MANIWQLQRGATVVNGGVRFSVWAPLAERVRVRLTSEGEGEYELAWLEGQGGTRSPMEGPLWQAIESWVAETEPDAAVAPICLAGFTDSHWLRDAFGTIAYGFFPMRYMDPQVATRLVHSADERVRIDDLELGVEFLRYAARAMEER